MPIGEDDIMFEEAWTSPIVLDHAMNITPNDKASNCYSSIASKIQCPICSRFFPAEDFGQCVGCPVSEFPLLKGQIGTTTRKRKRTETRTAHETMLAPCHECLDNLGEEEGATWGRCDNPRCWSRRDQLSASTKSFSEDNDIDSFFGGSVSRPTMLFNPKTYRQLGSSKIHKQGLSLVCPKCSPEGGLSCSHKWICDMCAFWDKHPLVWECPGCLDDYCDECEEASFGRSEEEERCIECGRRDLCRRCRQGMLSSPTNSNSGLHNFDPNKQLFSWRCRLCRFPACSSCVPAAHANGRIDSCRNCCSQLCGACRSLLACQRCGEEMCQLCLGESLVMLCRKCEHGS